MADIAVIALIGKGKAFTAKDAKERKGPEIAVIGKPKTLYHKGNEGTQRKSGTKISKAGLLDPGAPHDFGRADPNQFQIGTDLHIGVGRFGGRAERVERLNPRNLPVVPAFPKCSKMGYSQLTYRGSGSPSNCKERGLQRTE